MDITQILVKSGKIGYLTYLRILDILKAPYQHSEMMWIITPMIISIIFMTFYFGRYKKEELGWNTAFGNSLVMIFASLDLLRFQYNQGVLFNFNIQNILIAAIIIQGIVLTFFNFFHLLPKSLAYAISSGQTINAVIIFVIILIYSDIHLDIITALATAVLAGLFIGIMRFIQLIEPAGIDEDLDED